MNENENVEFKREVTDELKKEIVSFANSYGDTYENEVSVLQDLTFSKAKDIFRQHNMKLANEQMITLGLRKQNKLWTNLGLLLSDQCPFSVKTAVFAGKDQTEFRDRKEFYGSLLKQLEDSYEFMQLNNPTAASFQGLYRKDEKSFPDDALREALLNSIIHRDYSYSASTLISIYSDRIEFVSIGGLLPGIHKEDIMLGISVCRNKKLADIFYRLDLIEAYGTGIQKIRNAYGASDSKPEILVAPNSFKIILPQMVHDDALYLSEEKNSSEQQTVLDCIDTNGTITREKVETILQVSPSTAGRILRDMCDSSLIIKAGRGKSTRYNKITSQSQATQATGSNQNK